MGKNCGKSLGAGSYDLPQFLDDPADSQAPGVKTLLTFAASKQGSIECFKTERQQIGSELGDVYLAITPQAIRAPPPPNFVGTSE